MKTDAEQPGKGSKRIRVTETMSGVFAERAFSVFMHKRYQARYVMQGGMAISIIISCALIVVSS